MRLGEAALEQEVRSGTAQLLARVEAAFAGGEGWAERLRAAAYELRDFLCEDGQRARAMVLEAPAGNEATRRMREGGVAALAALIDSGRAELEEPGSVPGLAAEIAAGAIYNRIHLGLERGPEALDDEMVRELMYTAVLPYLGIEGAMHELQAPRPG